MFTPLTKTFADSTGVPPDSVTTIRTGSFDFVGADGLEKQPKNNRAVHKAQKAANSLFFMLSFSLT